MAHAAAVVYDAAVWLMAQAAGQAGALPDTIVTKQAPIEPGWFERLQETLRALMTLAILVLTVAVVPAAWNFRKSYQKISDLLDKVYADVTPLTHHAARIAENVDYVTTAVRADAQRASAVLAQAEARLTAALDRAEARARDFEALVHVAQDEAERTLVSAASAAAGVREGVASLRDDLAAALRVERVPRATPRVSAADEFADDALADDALADDALADDALADDALADDALADDALADDALADDVTLVDVGRVAGAGPSAGYTHALPAARAGIPSEDVIDVNDELAPRPAVGPRLRPRDRG